MLAWQRTLPPTPVEAEAGHATTWPHGEVPKQEAQRAPLFERSDKNKDGDALPRRIPRQFPGDRRSEGEALPAFDQDRDGQLSRDEFIFMGQ